MDIREHSFGGSLFSSETLAKCLEAFCRQHYDLAGRCQLWANFIRNGNPNGEDHHRTTNAQWEPYTPMLRYNGVLRQSVCEGQPDGL